MMEEHGKVDGGSAWRRRVLVRDARAFSNITVETDEPANSGGKDVLCLVSVASWW